METSFLQMAEVVLQEEKRSLTSREILQIAKDKGYDRLVKSWGGTPPPSLEKLILADVKDNPSSIFIPLGKDPVKFIVRSQLDKSGSGNKVRVLEHFYYDVDDFRIADVVATKGSIGTLLQHEECGTNRMMGRYTIRLDEIAPLTKQDYKNFKKHGYISVIVTCHVGFEVLLPPETFVVIQTSK